MMTDVTWMDATEAVANGFATEMVASGEPVTACFKPDVTARLGDVPARFQARVAELVVVNDSRQPAPPVPAAALAADVLRLCREAGCLDLAEGFVAKALPLADVQAALATERTTRETAKARAEEIRALCVTAKLPDLADGYIDGGMALAAVRDQLTRVTAKLAGAEIDGHLRPDAEATRRPQIDVVAVYAARNRLIPSHKE